MKIIVESTAPENRLGETLLIYLTARTGGSLPSNGKYSQIYYEAAKSLVNTPDEELIRLFEAWKSHADITITTVERRDDF